MKWFSNLLGMAAAGVLGYMAEPSLRPLLTGERPDAGLAAPQQPIAENPPVAEETVAPPVAIAPESVTSTTEEAEKPAATPEPLMPEPAPAAEPTPAELPAAAADSTDVVKSMQDSIKAAQIKEFTFEQVQEWNPGTDEIMDGETYQTGLAAYKAETIFGVKTIQAKALIKGGKVQRWVWPKSGMEIK